MSQVAVDWEGIIRDAIWGLYYLIPGVERADPSGYRRIKIAQLLPYKLYLFTDFVVHCGSAKRRPINKRTRVNELILIGHIVFYIAIYAVLWFTTQIRIIWTSYDIMFGSLMRLI